MNLLGSRSTLMTSLQLRILLVVSWYLLSHRYISMYRNVHIFSCHEVVDYQL